MYNEADSTTCIRIAGILVSLSSAGARRYLHLLQFHLVPSIFSTEIIAATDQTNENRVM